MDDRVSVTLADGTTEIFALGLGDIPEQYDPEQRKDNFSLHVRYTIHRSGALLVGYGRAQGGFLRRSGPVAGVGLGDHPTLGLTIVKAFAPSQWATVSGANYWRPERADHDGYSLTGEE